MDHSECRAPSSHRYVTGRYVINKPKIFIKLWHVTHTIHTGPGQTPLDDAVRAVAQSGITPFVAAGNEGSDACSTSPAREPLALTVGATNINDRVLWLKPGVGSNYGACVKMFAPGQQVVSADNASDTASKARSGTSQAAPFAAGVAALYLQNLTTASPAQVAAALTAAAVPGVLRDNTAQGAPLALQRGSPNLMLQSDMEVPLEVQPSLLEVRGDSWESRP